MTNLGHLFACSLRSPGYDLDAHAQVGDFSTMAELYTSIAKAYEIELSDIVFITKNTDAVDMEHKLGMQVKPEDTLYAHIKGEERTLTLKKSDPVLGVSFAENGVGVIFVRTVTPSGIMVSDTVPGSLHSPSHHCDRRRRVLQGLAMSTQARPIPGTRIVWARHFPVVASSRLLPYAHMPGSIPPRQRRVCLKASTSSRSTGRLWTGNLSHRRPKCSKTSKSTTS